MTVYVNQSQSPTTSLKFIIEVYDLSNFKDKISSPNRKINTWEWYIDFKNLITPYKELDMNYQIAAHVEPSQPLWEVGKEIIGNIKAFLDNIRNHQLRNSYKSEVYLWIQAPGQDISFPIILKTGNVTFNTLENKIEMEVNREELGKYGIAPKFGSFELPAKIGNTKAGVRIYQTPILHQPWNRVTFNISYIQKLIEGIQNRPILNSIFTKILQNTILLQRKKKRRPYRPLNNRLSTPHIRRNNGSNHWLYKSKSNFRSPLLACSKKKKL